MIRNLTWALMIVTFVFAVPHYGRPIVQANDSRPDVPPRSPSTEERIAFAAVDAGLPPRIALARFWEESRYRHVDEDGNVLRGSLDDCGIAQLRERFFPGSCSMTEDESIQAGVELMAEYWEEFHSARLVHLAYKAGPAAARKLQALELR